MFVKKKMGVDNNYRKSKVKKGNIVFVTSGDSRGQEGEVLSFDRSRGLIVVKGINITVRHSKSQGIYRKESPIHVSNVKVVSGESL